LREPILEDPLSFDFELGDIKYNRSGQTVVQIIVPFEFGDINLKLQRAIGLLMHAEVSKADVLDVQPE
jgi:hypothetical protein